MLDIIFHTIIDSIRVFIFAFIIYVLFSFLENKISSSLSKNSKASPLYGAMIGLVPQCGVSVVASDLYLKRHITTGTLLAVFISCSDEALPILLSSGDEKSLMIIPIILIKFILGFMVGFIMDLLIGKKEVKSHLDECDYEHIETHIGCCNHHIEEKSILKSHLLHPLLHSLKLFIYVLVINFVFSLTIYLVGEENLILFLETNKYISPIVSMLIGLIPNCASSVILIELYISNGLSFGAILAGLIVNSGLGLLYLLKDKNNLKNTISILITLILISLITGYLTCLLIGF